MKTLERQGNIPVLVAAHAPCEPGVGRITLGEIYPYIGKRPYDEGNCS
jgi:hypothetical protein